MYGDGGVVVAGNDYSARNSCIMHPRLEPWVRLFSSYLAICDWNRSGAFLLHWLEYATNKLAIGDDGWVTVSFRELAEQSLGTASASALCSQADRLESLGLIEKRAGGPPGSKKPSSYRIVVDRLQEAVFKSCGFSSSSVHPQNGETDPPFTHRTESVHPQNGEADSVLIDDIKGNTKETDNPQTPLELDRPIDKWATDQAHSIGLKMNLNTARKRQALQDADSTELRQRIVDFLERRVAHGEDATPGVLNLIGFSNQRRSSGISRQQFGASHARSYATILNQTKVDTALQETPLAQEIRDCRSAADLTPRLGDFINMPAWKVAALDAMRLQDKKGFHKRLTETFTNLADDYRQGVTTDAIVEAFFDSEQRHIRSRRNSKTAGLAEYIESLGSREA